MFYGKYSINDLSAGGDFRRNQKQETRSTIIDLPLLPASRRCGRRQIWDVPAQIDRCYSYNSPVIASLEQ